MSGAVLVKLGVNPTNVSIETIIRDTLGGSICFFHQEKHESGFQNVVVEAEVADFDEVESEFEPHEQLCSLITNAIHCDTPGAVRVCSAIWLDDGQWYLPEPGTHPEAPHAGIS